MTKIFASLVGRRCRAAQHFRAEQQLCPTRKVKNFVMHPVLMGAEFLTGGSLWAR
jgi:hypothetical protein